MSLSLISNKMEAVDQFRENVIISFDNVRRDIRNLQERYDILERKHKRVLLILRQSQEENEDFRLILNRLSRPRLEKIIYIGSKDSNKYHIRKCPYAQNIKRSRSIIFSNKPIKRTACRCVN